MDWINVLYTGRERVLTDIIIDINNRIDHKNIAILREQFINGCCKNRVIHGWESLC